MAYNLLNTLFVMTQGTYIRLDHDTLTLEAEGKQYFQIPLHHVGGVVVFGNVLVSPFALQKCAEDGCAFVWLGRNGRFKGRLVGRQEGSVLLRRAQHTAFEDAEKSLKLARNIVAGKVQNARQVALRAAREAVEPQAQASLSLLSQELAALLPQLRCSPSLDEVRGFEGRAARSYFANFQQMIRVDRDEFAFAARTRRPPRDRVNALLSFLYAMLLGDCVAAVEGVGLDPQVGYLHAIRPGRPSLALDLMEEFRPLIADRLALTMINRRQISHRSFEERVGGAVGLTDRGRRDVIAEYQKRKEREVLHPVTKRKMPLGLVPHAQARLLAQFVRNDLEEYMPFLGK